MNEIVRLDWDALHNCIDHALYQGQGEGKPTTDNVVDWIKREAVKPVEQRESMSAEDRALIAEALAIGAETLRDYAGNFSSVDNEVDGGRTWAEAQRMADLSVLFMGDNE